MMKFLHKIRHLLRLTRTIEWFRNDNETYGCDFLDTVCTECGQALSTRHSPACRLCKTLHESAATKGGA